MSDEDDIGAAVKLLREKAAADFCVDQNGHNCNLTCNCLCALQANVENGDTKINAVARFVVSFHRLPKKIQKEVVGNMIREAENRDVSGAACKKRHLKYTMPMVLDSTAHDKDNVKPHLICKSALMFIIGKKKDWMKGAAAAAAAAKANNDGISHPPPTSPNWSTWAAEEARAANKQIKQRKRKAVSTSASSRKFKGHLAILGGKKCRGGDPMVKFVSGNAAKREEGFRWLEKARSKCESIAQARLQEQLAARERVKRKSTRQIYSNPNHDPGKELMLHAYQDHVFYDDSCVDAGFSIIKTLGNADAGANIDDCLVFNNFVGSGDTFLENQSLQNLELIKAVPAFQCLAIESMTSKANTAAWCNVIVSLETMLNIEELMECSSDKALKDPFKHTFRAASLHDQAAGDEMIIQQYSPHRDKLGNIVCFLPLAGSSYNFIAMEPKRVNQVGKKELAEFETDAGSFKAYKRYKESDCLSRKELTMIMKFESDFMKMATQQNLTRVRVYKLEPSDKLLFPAKDYLHGTIIPKQKQGNRRALLVFHDLVLDKTLPR